MKFFKIFVFLFIGMNCFALASCNEEVSFISNQSPQSQYSNEIIVDIKGAVCFPGLYSVKEDSLLIDVIKLAGGLLDIADDENINFAMPIMNNQMIVIPSKLINNKNSSSDNLININTGTISDLSNLPGIGTSKAQNIVDYRTTCGKFTSIDQLKNVSGKHT